MRAPSEPSCVNGGGRRFNLLITRGRDFLDARLLSDPGQTGPVLETLTDELTRRLGAIALGTLVMIEAAFGEGTPSPFGQ